MKVTLIKKCVTNPVNLRQKQVSVVLYERFENALICKIFTSLSAGFAQISNFSIFRQTGDSLELLKLFLKIVYPTGYFGERKEKFRIFANVHGFSIITDNGS